MKTYKVAPTKLDDKNVVFVSLGKQYIGKTEDIKESIRLFRKIFGVDEIIIFILDETERPLYYGNQDIIRIIDKSAWKSLPWQECTVNS